LALHKLVTNPTPLNIVDVCVFLVLNFGELVLAGVLAVRGWQRRGIPAAGAVAEEVSG
jgi:hypothetical protein